ncbi:MAG: tetratricopeptide repeat protein [Verrucomicrobiae bacterium]|nr:tetratricopeptide repeat protein [Verrucomicrobiae bacterium]MCP5541689.1 tetratricopeptide repeat protein [Akkermansiaceae bacterium]MCP5551677.1 tetratricopeptide repeat protein [Akkermansiaceae bacterium]
MKSRLAAIVFCGTPIVSGSGHGLFAQAPAPDAPPVQTPAGLLESARAAFDAADFATAESNFQRFMDDYGQAEETREAVRIHTPLLAVCKIRTEKFGEALEWIARSFEDPKLDPAIADELSFFRGHCLMLQRDLPGAQTAFGEYWADTAHHAARRYEALLLFAHLYLSQDLPETAAEMLADQVPKIRAAQPEAASRGAVLQLHALMASGQLDAALALVRDQYPRLEEMTQPVAFQTMTLSLGSRFLERQRWHDAIVCLQRIWPREKLLSHQLGKKAEIEKLISDRGANPAAQSQVMQLEGILKRVEREIANFEKVENYDSALRFRLATAFQGLERWREAALVLEDMLVTLPPDPVVDSASLATIQCWIQIGRWPRAVAAADRYLEKFADTGKNLPMVLYLRAEALREDLQIAEAQLAYGDLLERYPDDPLAGKAAFMQGFLYLQQDDNEGALFEFDRVRKNYADSGLVEDADYWSGMALAFSKQYEAAREAMRSYLEKYESTGAAAPKYRKEAVFRVAVCAFSLGEYEESIDLFDQFVAAHEGDPLADEANLLLGDALCALGEIDRGIAAYGAIRPDSIRFFEDGWFKTGKALKLTERFDEMRTHFERFASLYPESNRLPEAIYWIGWNDLQAGKPHKAREIYWETLELHGERPDLHSMEDLILALPMAYESDGKAGRGELLRRLEQMRFQADNADRPTLALRCAWGRARLLSLEDPARGRAALLALQPEIDPKRHNPMIAVDCAEALMDAENFNLARALLTEVRKWHPRAIQKDRVFAGLGRLAEEDGDTEKALEYYTRFERETAGSTRLGTVRLAKARLQSESGDTPGARATLEALLEDSAATAPQKAEALLALGETYAASREWKTSLPYFERVYVAYGKFGELNARAYQGRAQALERLGLNAEALEVYEELAARPDLRSFPQTGEARAGIARLESFRRKPAAPAEVAPQPTEAR